MAHGDYCGTLASLFERQRKSGFIETDLGLTTTEHGFLCKNYPTPAYQCDLATCPFSFNTGCPLSGVRLEENREYTFEELREYKTDTVHL